MKRCQQSRIFAIGSACSLLGIACFGAPVTPEIWSPNKAQLSHLAPVTTVNKYRIQPPQGYSFHTQPGPAGSVLDAWVGPAQTNGSHPYLAILFFGPPTGEKNKYTLSQVSAKMIAAVAGRRTNWKQSPTQQGSIHGITFLRTYWQGVDSVTGQAMRGFSYVAKDGNAFVQMASQDVEAPQPQVGAPQDGLLSLAEAAALTFTSLPKTKQ